MQNPFTTTFSKIPTNTYIPTEKTTEIIENFSYDDPSESVYKITGVRGSGKTVLLATVEKALSTEESKEDGWLVYRLSPSRDMLVQLASKMQADGLIPKEKIQLDGVDAEVSIKVAKAEGSIKVVDQTIFDIGQQIDEALRKVLGKKKILVGVDEVSRTDEMITFCSEFGNWLRAGYPIYLVCTGLYKNMESLSNVSNLTFFKRATNIKTEPLNTVRMTEIYKQKLKVEKDVAKELAALTKGYAYAFQELGTLYFKREEDFELDDIIDSLKAELYAYAYEKEWEGLSEEDRAFIKIISDKAEYKREDVLKKMDKPSNYSVYRDRLTQRGIITSRQGYISLALPFFDDYIQEYHL